MDRRRQSPRRTHHHRGVTTPMVAVALLVAMLGIALILDRLWLSSAKLELTAGAEAAALAAGRELTVDARLLETENTSALLDHARQAAAEIAAQNLVAGSPMQMDADGGDVRFLKLQPSSEPDHSPEKIETDRDPTEVWIHAQRTRFRGNPVALFMRDLTGQPFGDVVTEVGVRINSHITSIRPFDDVAAPVFPLAIWKRDPTGKRKDTWQTAIEDRQGKDQYGYDSDRHVVTMQSDGIPELALITAKRRDPAFEANVQLLDLGTDLDPALVEQQILMGLTREQLEQDGGELQRSTHTSVPHLDSRERSALEEQLGEQRIAMLYTESVPFGKNGYRHTTCVEFVAIRILAVNDLPEGRCQLIVQPTVMTTRMAVAESNPSPMEPGNRYVSRLELIH